MYKLDQNRKILLSAAVLFAISFSVMIFFLQRYSHNVKYGAASVLHGSDHDSKEIHTEVAHPWDEYIEDDAVAFVTTPDGHVVYANKAFEDLVDLQGHYEDMLLFDMLEADDLSSLVKALTEIIQTGESKDTIGPLQITNKNKSALAFLNAEPVLEDDHVEYIVFEVIDLTDKIDELKESDEQAEDSGIQKVQYPKIRELPQDGHHNFRVEKISYDSE